MAFAHISLGQEDSKHEDTHEFLAVLSAVHEGHGGSAGNLGAAEEAVCLSAVAVPEEQFHQPDRDPAGDEAENGGEQEAIENLDPLGRIDSVDAVMQGDRGSRQAGDQGVAFAGRNSEPPCGHGPCDDGGQPGAERNQRLVAVASKIDHIVNGGGHTLIKHGHEKNSQKIENGRHQNRILRGDGPGRDAGSDGVRGVGPAVDQNNAQRQNRGNGKRRAGRESC